MQHVALMPNQLHQLQHHQWSKEAGLWPCCCPCRNHLANLQSPWLLHLLQLLSVAAAAAAAGSFYSEVTWVLGSCFCLSSLLSLLLLLTAAAAAAEPSCCSAAAAAAVGLTAGFRQGCAADCDLLLLLLLLLYSAVLSLTGRRGWLLQQQQQQQQQQPRRVSCSKLQSCRSHHDCPAQQYRCCRVPMQYMASTPLHLITCAAAPCAVSWCACRRLLLLLLLVVIVTVLPGASSCCCQQLLLPGAAAQTLPQHLLQQKQLQRLRWQQQRQQSYPLQLRQLQLQPAKGSLEHQLWQHSIKNAKQ
jgi:hypothetical protein